jgi:hypothetical protein
VWLFGFIFGAGIGVIVMLDRPPLRSCPSVEGQKVVTSYHVADGHYCVYVPAGGTGRTKRVVKL